MGANVDAGTATVGSSLDPWDVIHAGGTVHVPCADTSSLIRDGRSRIGRVEFMVRPEQAGPSEIGPVLTTVNAEDLRTAPRSRSPA